MNDSPVRFGIQICSTHGSFMLGGNINIGKKYVNFGYKSVWYGYLMLYLGFFSVCIGRDDF